MTFASPAPPSAPPPLDALAVDGEVLPNGEVLPWEADIEGDHDWQFRYNRRLCFFSSAVSSLAFSPDGRRLASGTNCGNVKIWDTCTWAEAAKLKGCRREDPRALVFSPSQRWLIVAYTSALHIFHTQPPWRLEKALPATMAMPEKTGSSGKLSLALANSSGKEPAALQWFCVAFSPMAEVDHEHGATGQDNHIAAASTQHLVVLDYSGGWCTDAPKRTRSLFHGAKPTGLAYTSSGAWIVCAYDNGTMQVWNAFSLTNEKTLSGHDCKINCLVSSPKAATYDARFVSCSVDQSLRVWHSCGWILEQIVMDTRCDLAGIRHCAFSSTGDWLVSVAFELAIWRVCTTVRQKLALRLHQRLANTCGAESLRSAAFSNHNDCFAAGSRDGILGLWIKFPGAPAQTDEGSGPEQRILDRQLPGGGQDVFRPKTTEAPASKPMQKVCEGGIFARSLGSGSRRSHAPAEWFQHANRLHMSPLHMSAATQVGGSMGVGGSSQEETPQFAQTFSAGVGVLRSVSAPYLQRHEATAGSLASTFEPGASWSFSSLRRRSPGAGQTRLGSPPALAPLGRRPSGSLVDDGTDAEESAPVSPMRKSMMHACRGAVQRVTLDPRVITDHSG